MRAASCLTSWRVNSALAALKSGDICEILTRRGSVPKKDWLRLVKTARARSKIRSYLREKGIVA